MTDLGQSSKELESEPIDGRVARRQRNIDAVIDVVLEMFAEDAMFPTIEQAASRSGLSLRSLYRYFADPAELLEAAIKRSNERGRELSQLDAIGQGSLEVRIDDFVEMRLRVHRELGANYRATGANASRHPRVAVERKQNCEHMRKQFELQFAPELAALNGTEREARSSAGDLLTQLSSVDFLRHQRGLSVAKTRDVLIVGLRSLLA